MEGNVTANVERPSEAEISKLEGAILAAGIKPDSGESFKRVLKVLRFIESERHWKHVIRGFRLLPSPPATNAARQFSQEKIDAIAKALTPWGREHFDNILRFVPCLSPSKVGVARAMRNMSKDMDEVDAAPARNPDVSHIFDLTASGTADAFAFGQDPDGKWHVYQRDEHIAWRHVRACSDSECDRCWALSSKFKFTWHTLADGSTVVAAWTPR